MFGEKEDIQLTKKNVPILLVLLLVFFGLLFTFSYNYPLGVDWEGTFSQVEFWHPFEIRTFVNPPFILFFLPHAFLPVRIGNAINLVLQIGVILFAIYKLRGGWLAILLVFTNPVFPNIFRTNNVDWLPLLGLLLGPIWGTVPMLSKPHALGGALLIWVKKDRRVIYIGAAVVLLSFWLWGFWVEKLLFNPIDAHWNLSVLPIGIPYGLYLLKKAWDTDDPYLAAVSTPLLTPYIASYSFVSVLVVLSSKYPKAAKWLYFGLWALVIILYRREHAYSG